MELTVMTYNIQHGILHLEAMKKQAAFNELPEEEKERQKAEMREKRARGESTEDLSLIDLKAMADAIRPFSPDVLSLNEMRDQADFPGFEAQARIIADYLGYPYFFFAKAIDIGGQGPYGNALLSRYPFTSIERVLIPDPEVKDEPTYYETRCLIKAAVEIPDPASPVTDAQHLPVKTLSVINTHFGLASSEAQNAVTTVLENTDPSRPTILMGDFNLTPDSPILQQLFAKYKDAADLIAGPCPSFPSEAPEIKIDYIMGTAPITFLEAKVPEVIVSDHRPFVAKISF